MDVGQEARTVDIIAWVKLLHELGGALNDVIEEDRANFVCGEQVQVCGSTKLCWRQKEVFQEPPEGGIYGDRNHGRGIKACDYHDAQ